MQDALRYAWYGNDHDAFVYRIFDDSRLIGWALSFKEAFMTVKGPVDRNVVHSYVRVTERRKGYGSRLLEAVFHDRPDSVVFPHDDRSRGFYHALAVPNRQQEHI